MLVELQELDLSQEDPGVGGNRTARLKNQFEGAIAQALFYRSNVLCRGSWLFILITHAETTTEVEVFDGDATPAEFVDQCKNAVECIKEGINFSELAADMAIDALHVQARQACGFFVNAYGVINIDTELVVFQAGRNVRVSLCINVRIHTQGYRCCFSQF